MVLLTFFAFHEANATPFGMRLNAHVCKKFFAGEWEGSTRSCFPSSAQGYELASGTLTIPKGVTLNLVDVDLTIGKDAQLINNGNVMMMRGHLVINGSFTTNGSFVQFGRIDISGTLQNNGVIDSYDWINIGSSGIIDNNSTLNMRCVSPAFGDCDTHTIRFESNIANYGQLNNYNSINIVGPSVEIEVINVLDGKINNYGNLEGFLITNAGYDFLGVGSPDGHQAIINNYGTLEAAINQNLQNGILNNYDRIVAEDISNDATIVNCDALTYESFNGNEVESCPM